MTHHVLSHSFYIEDIVAMVQRVYAGRVRFRRNGAASLASALTRSAATPAVCRSCACIRIVAGWCWPSDACSFR